MSQNRTFEHIRHLKEQVDFLSRSCVLRSAPGSIRGGLPLGFHEDGTQNAIRFTPNSPGNLSSPGYFKAFNDTNLSNEDLFVQFVPASGGDSRFDSWVGDMVFSVSNGGGRFEGFRLDGGGNPIFAKPFQPASLADTSASSDTVYYSQTQSKLVYKDSSGVVHVLY